MGPLRALRRLQPVLFHRLQSSGHRQVGPEKSAIDFAKQSYVREVARARTFGFMQEVEYLRENGLALGGGLDNAIVLDEYRVLNADGLRYGDEFVRHKILDAIGDLYLVGHPLLAAFTAHKSGHALNNLLARELLARQDAWEMVSFNEVAKAPCRRRPLAGIAGLSLAGGRGRFPVVSPIGLPNTRLLFSGVTRYPRFS